MIILGGGAVKNRAAAAIDTQAMFRDELRRGRGARSNVSGRYEAQRREAFDDGWEGLADLAPFKTTIYEETARSIVSRNDSPDLSFEQSINPYRGCEHGCVYCYARPGHAFLGHSPGLDFETQLYAKTNAAEVLERTFRKKGYVPKVIALGAVTDPYQPIERRYEISRRILEVMERYNHPVGIVTKSAGILRDVDVLSRLAKRNLVRVAVSVTTLDRQVGRAMEPRASTPSRRLDAIRQLSAAGVPVAVMMAPIIPGLNDHEIEAVLDAGRTAGAESTAYVLLRLPLELKDLFREWLATEFPDRARKVIKLLQEMHGGKDYTSDFGIRQRGTGPTAQLIGRRFRLATQRLGLNARHLRMRTDLFRVPGLPGEQLGLF